MAIRVSVGARLHFGFLNLSLARERLYGGLGVALDAPRAVLRVERAREVLAPDDEVAEYGDRAAEYLDVPGGGIEVESAARDALSVAGLDGEVLVVEPRRGRGSGGGAGRVSGYRTGRTSEWTVADRVRRGRPTISEPTRHAFSAVDV